MEGVIADVRRRFSGRFALYAEHLATGEVIAYDADAVFHSASTIKLAILLALFREAAAGNLSLDDPVPVPAEGRAGGSGVLASLGPDLRLSLHDLAVLMTVVSDNTATNVCIDAVGIKTVNKLMTELDLPGLRLNRKVRSPGSRDDDVPFGTASPRGLARLLTLLARGEAGPPAVCEAVLAVLRKQQQNTLLTRYLPGWDEYNPRDGLVVASKSGRIRGVHHDAGLITQRGSTYVIAVMSDGCADERYHLDNEALVELPKLSLAVHREWAQEGAAELYDGPWTVFEIFHSIYEADQLASVIRSGGWPVLVRPAQGAGLALSGILPGHAVQVPASAESAIRTFLETDPSA